MKRSAKCLLTLITFLFCLLSVSVGAQEQIYGVKPEIVDFSGKLVNAGSKIALKSSHFSGLTNFRYHENCIGTRLGTANFTSNAEPNRNPVVGVWHFPNENKECIIAASHDNLNSITYWQVQSGSFSASNSISKTSGTTATRISTAMVRDTFCIGDAGGVTLYSGASVYPTALLVEYVNGIYTDLYDWIYSGTSNSATAGATVYVGYSRPFTKLQASKEMGTMDSVASSVTEVLKSGKMRYWASYVVKTGGSSFYEPKIEVPARELGTAWDGKGWMSPQIAGFEKTGVSEFQDYSLMVIDGSDETTMDISEWQSGGTITVGFPYRPRSIKFVMPESYKNDVVSSVSAYVWNGSSYTVCANQTNGTSYGGKAFKQTGLFEFDKLSDAKKRKIGQSPIDMYMMVFKVSKTISNYVRIAEIQAIPDYDSPSVIGKYRGVATNHNSLWLYDGRDKTKVLVSVPGEPDCFVGPRSVPEDDPLFVGKQEGWIGMWALGPDTLAMKETENWVIKGTNANDYVVEPLYGTVPCVSGDGVAVIEFEGKIFAMYPGRDGIYLLNASGENPKKSNDIRAYWEPSNALELSAAKLALSKGWFSKTFDEYHLLVGTTELVYSFRHDKWTIFDRGSSAKIESGTFFIDRNKKRFELSGGTGGTVFQLESGTSDYGSAIVSEFEKPPISLGGRSQTKNELRTMALRFELPSGDTTLSGATVYLKSSLEASEVEGQVGWSFIDNGFDQINMSEWRAYTKGYYHKIRVRFPGRINLNQMILWSTPAPWKARDGFETYDDESGIGRVKLE